MTWSHVQDAPGGNAVGAGGSTSQAAGAFASPAALGDFVVVGAWGNPGAGQASAGVTCSDNATTPNTYTQVKFAQQGTSHAWVALFAAKVTSNPSSGNLDVTVSATGANSGLQVCAAEFSGGSLTTDGSSSTTNAGSASPAPGPMTTTTPGDLLLAAFTDNSSANPETMTDPSGYSSTGRQTNG